MNTTSVSIVSFAQAPHVRETHGTTNGVEMLVPIFKEALDNVGLSKKDIGFWCSGSSDYLAGRAFSFIAAVDAIGAFPPIHESHVEADAAWALYEAWVKIRMGEVDTALVYGFGKSSAGQLRRVLAMQLDPYTVGPLWPDAVSIAGLQARFGLDAGLWTERDMAEVAARCRGGTADELLKQPYFADPLRKHDCAPVTDGAAAIVLAAEDRAAEAQDQPAWIRGIAHHVDPLHLGARDLARAPSAQRAARSAGVDVAPVDVAELHAPFSHQELILRQELGIGDDTSVNPSGGALASNPMFSAGLIRIGEAARRIWSGEAGRAVGHATQGPALQQNLVCVLASEGAA